MSLLSQLLLGPCLIEKHEGVFVAEPLKIVGVAKRVQRLPVRFIEERGK